MPVYQLQESEQDTLPPATKSAISRAKTSWLKNTEVVDLLLNHQKYRLPVSSDPPNKPAGRHTSFAPKLMSLRKCQKLTFPISTV